MALESQSPVPLFTSFDGGQCDVATISQRAVMRIRPGHRGCEVLHHLQVGKKNLDLFRVSEFERTEPQPFRLEDRRLTNHPSALLAHSSPPEATLTQNFVTSVKLNSFTCIAGTTMSNDSSPLARTGTLIAATFDSMAIKLWLKRKLRRPHCTLPFSIRNVPSRVIPVTIFSYGSTSRIYHRRVTSTPRSVDEIISLISCGLSGALKTMFIGISPTSFGKGNPCPVASIGPTLSAYSDFFIF